MTCIVGLVEDGDVFIGADSLASNHQSKVVVKNPKIVRLAKPTTSYPTDVLIGYTSSWRMGQLLTTMKLPKNGPKDDTFEWMATHFVDAVRQRLKDGGWATSRDGQESGGEFIVGISGRLFKVQSDYSVLETVDGYDATGSGEDWALGSLHATSSIGILSAEKRLTMALDAAATFNPNVAPPFHVALLTERTIKAVA